MRNEKFKLILFVIYTILYECLVWGLVAAAIYYLKWNEWTVLVGVIMSGAQLKPNHFGLKYKYRMKSKKMSKKLSNCCNEPIEENTDICTKCKEHCEVNNER